MMIQKLALYNIEWQVLRINLSFRTMETIVVSTDKLLTYMNDEIEGYDTRSNKLWRVINLLNATVMGLYGQVSLSRSPQRTKEVEAMITYVQEFRESFQKEYHASNKEFRWVETIEERAIAETSEFEVQAVLDSLIKRKNFAKEYKRMQVEKTRPELLKYVTMLQARLN